MVAFPGIKFIVPFEGKYYAQAFDGKKGWNIDAFKNETTPTQLSGKAALSQANEDNVEMEDAFIGKEIIEGGDCFHIKFVRSIGEDEDYYIDEVSSAIVMKTAPSKNAELSGTILNTTYGDYREVGGIRIPFRSVSKSNDQLILEVIIEKAEANASIKPQEFEAPYYFKFE